MSTSPRQAVSADMADTEVTVDSGNLRTGFRFFSKGGILLRMCQIIPFVKVRHPSWGWDRSRV